MDRIFGPAGLNLAMYGAVYLANALFLPKHMLCIFEAPESGVQRLLIGLTTIIVGLIITVVAASWDSFRSP